MSTLTDINDRLADYYTACTARITAEGAVYAEISAQQANVDAALATQISAVDAVKAALAQAQDDKENAVLYLTVAIEEYVP